VDVVKDRETGQLTELRCTYDPETKSGSSQSNRKVKATIHWVSAEHAKEAEVRMYDHLFSKEDPDDVPDGVDWLTNVNPKSLELLTECRVEPVLASAKIGELYQFERLGYFCVDSVDSSENKPVFNRTVTLRDSWANLQKAAKRSK
jgi:glutaminyl-tRNA synthetase